MKLDPRIEGKELNEITKAWVKSVLTKEELSKEYYVTTSPIFRTHVCNLDLEEALMSVNGYDFSEEDFFSAALAAFTGELTNIRETIYFIKDAEELTENVVIEVRQGSEGVLIIELSGTKEIRKLVSPAAYFQTKWKEDLKEFQKEQKEYREFLRLKEKFGEE